MKNLLSRERHLSPFKNCLNNVLFLSNYTLKQYFQSTSSRFQHRTVNPTTTGWPSIRHQRLRLLYKCFRIRGCIETFKQILKVRFIKSIEEFYRILFINAQFFALWSFLSEKGIKVFTWCCAVENEKSNDECVNISRIQEDFFSKI